MAILANSTITLVSYLDAYGAAVEGGFEGSEEDFYDDLSAVEELPGVYSTVQSHDGQLTSHGAIFTAMAVSTNQQGQVVGVEKTYSELTSKQLSIEENLHDGGVNLLDNATYGGREAPDDGLWCADETVCYVLTRFEDMTVDVIVYPVMGESEQDGIPAFNNAVYPSYIEIGKTRLYSITDDETTISDELASDGTVTRRIGIYEYDGTEEWQTWGGGAYIVFYRPRPDGAKIGGMGMSSHALRGVNYEESWVNRFEFAGNGNIDFAFHSDDTGYLDSFVQHLKDMHEAGQPFTVYYELDTVIIEKHDLPDRNNVLDIIGDLTITEVLEMGW